MNRKKEKRIHAWGVKANEIMFQFFSTKYLMSLPQFLNLRMEMMLMHDYVTSQDFFEDEMKECMLSRYSGRLSLSLLLLLYLEGHIFEE